LRVVQADRTDANINAEAPRFKSLALNFIEQNLKKCQKCSI